MSRVLPPPGYATWNAYIEEQANLSSDQSLESRRLIKRNIKLGMIAQAERQAGGDINNPRYRQYNVYSAPGTISPSTGHPWKKS